MEAVRIRFETLGIVRHENQLALGGTVRQAPQYYEQRHLFVLHCYP